MSDREGNENLKRQLIASYKKPESRSVGKLELQNLPLRAGLTIALRCVYRLRPVFCPCYDDPLRDQSCNVFDVAVEAAERLVLGQDVASIKCIELADLAESVSRRAIPGGTVAYAASQLVYALDAIQQGKTSQVINAAATAISVCRNAIPLSTGEACNEIDKVLQGHMLDFGTDLLRDSIANDYDALLSLELGSFPNLGHPLDPSEQGPLGTLWAEEPPSWYAKQKG